jgi:hypothetical protein
VVIRGLVPLCERRDQNRIGQDFQAGIISKPEFLPARWGCEDLSPRPTRKTRRFDAVWRFKAAFESLPVPPCRNV